ncbi:alkaline phosphatase PhoX [Deinococcus sp.]|uniref:alkaline phosphatase PhoX n=1 Tax=Deinococcus sp. TaxID=47478 RepID=UPI003B5BC0F3
MFKTLKKAALPVSLGLILSGCGNTINAAPTEAIPTTPATPQSEIAPFLDTAKIAKALGGSMEWRKMEGVAYDPAAKMLYIAVSVIGKGMSDGKGDIQFADNECGGIFAAQLGGDMNAAKITPILVGKPLSEGVCDESAISEPDNIFVDKSGRLWIGEDTGNHANNMLWLYEPKTQTLKRFATVPAGAEVTGLRVADDGTLFMNFQHPNETNPAPYNVGTIGVISGFDGNAGTFNELPIPQGADMGKVLSAAGTYTILGQSGQAMPGSAAALKYGEVRAADGTSMLVCDNPDANMFLPQDANAGTLYTHFECQPGGVTQSELKKVNGTWQTVSAKQLDFSAVGGTWNNCNGSVTPWGTALSSEEYPAETDADWAKAEPAMSQSLGRKANRYDFGRISELTRSASGETQIKKHYAMGQGSWEMALVLPDQKTAYFGDDGTDRGLYKFVADTAGDLSSGTLSIAKLAQVDDPASANGKALNITWVKMGHGVDKNIEQAIRNLD